MTLKGTLFSVTELNTDFLISAMRDVGDAIPYKATFTALPLREISSVYSP